MSSERFDTIPRTVETTKTGIIMLVINLPINDIENNITGCIIPPEAILPDAITNDINSGINIYVKSVNRLIVSIMFPIT